MVRASKLEKQRDRHKDDIKQRLLVIAENQDEVDSLREQLHESEEELQRIDNEKILLCQPVGAPAGPMDFGQCIEAMRGSLGKMFDDPRLSAKARGKKDEVEADFVTMCNFAAKLSSIKIEYDTASQLVEPATTSSSADIPSPAAGEGPAVGGGTSVAEGEPAAAPAAVESPPLLANAPVPDGPSQERTINRERTPPPGSRAKAVLKMSDDEIAGPRKAKGSKEGGKATA